MEADPDIKADVDLMILDYLAAIAIERTLHAGANPSQQTEEEAGWLVASVNGKLIQTRSHGMPCWRMYVLTGS